MSDLDTPVGHGFTVGDLVQFKTKSDYPGRLHARWDGPSQKTRCNIGIAGEPRQWDPANGGYPCRRCFPSYRTYGTILNRTRDLVQKAQT